MILNAIAYPLSVSLGRIRFRSNLNGRIFSLVMDEDLYELVELESNDAHALPLQHLYRGRDGFQVMNVIWKEVNDVQRT